MSDLSTTFYRKYNSFQDFVLLKRLSSIEEQIKRSVSILESAINAAEHNNTYLSVLEQCIKSFKNALELQDSNLRGAACEFVPSEIVAEEMALIEDKDIPDYIYHRYRYEVYPKNRTIDDYPPCIQIEPTSVCNYRCKFCYQTNKEFSGRESPWMGHMNITTFRRIVDEIEGKVRFVTMASRGEPLLCPDIVKMISYARGKFLNLKLNTNGSLIDEEKAHALLSGGVNTLVISVDAHNKEMYEEMRVNGKFENLEKRLRLLAEIRRKHYRNQKVTVRLSGVYIDERQDMNMMVEKWKEYVDQITYVRYNPWEDVYNAEVNGLKEPCSDLWRRLFVWHDGSINCCDTDYKSSLLSGMMFGERLKKAWRSDIYERIRDAHANNKRQEIDPCDKCTLV